MGRPPGGLLPEAEHETMARCGRSTSTRVLENFAMRPGRLASAPNTSNRIPSPHGSASPSEERAARRAALIDVAETRMLPHVQTPHVQAVAVPLGAMAGDRKRKHRR